MIYIWGDVTFNNNLQDQPRQVTELEMKKIVQIACGTSFIVTLSNDGKLYSWGRNENGQLGINAEGDISMSPCLITSLENVEIVKIVCGSEHSLALTSKGKIYSWGNNCKGQLGHGERFKLERGPIMLAVSLMGNISDIAAQDSKSVAINKIGYVYVWGYHCSQTIWEPIKTSCSSMYDLFRYKIPYIIHDNTKENSIMLEIQEDVLKSPADVIVQIKGQFIYVHKAILNRCEYFRNLFQNNWKEAKENTIKCDDSFPYNVYKTFFKYLYTNAIDNLPLEETFELFRLCDKYDEEKTANKCIEMIKKIINVSNVALCYKKASTYDVKDLMEFCIQFSFNRMTDVVKSKAFAKLNKELLLDFIRKTSDAGAYIHA